MSSGNESFENRVFDALAPILLWGGVIAAGCFALYWTAYGVLFAILWVIPYLIFCALPCIALSFGLGILFAVLCRVDPSREEKPDRLQIALDRERGSLPDILSRVRLDLRVFTLFDGTPVTVFDGSCAACIFG